MVGAWVEKQGGLMVAVSMVAADRVEAIVVGSWVVWVETVAAQAMKVRVVLRVVAMAAAMMEVVTTGVMGVGCVAAAKGKEKVAAVTAMEVTVQVTGMVAILEAS